MIELLRLRPQNAISKKNSEPAVPEGLISQSVSQSLAEAKPPANWLILTILADLLTYIAYKLLISYA